MSEDRSTVLLFLALSCAAPDQPVGHAWRLTHRQWENTVVDLLGLPEPTGLSDDLVPDPASTFDTDTTTLSVSPTLWQQYQFAAETLAERAVTDPDVYAVVVPAELRPWGVFYTVAERDRWVEDFGRRAFRRPLDGDEVPRFGALFEAGAGIFGSGDAFLDGVHAVVAGMLQSPGFLYRTEGLHGDAAPGELSPDELAARLSYALWNTAPDETLRAAAEADGLAPDTLRAQVDRMLDDPRGHATLADLHRQLLHVDAYSQIWRPDEEVLSTTAYADSVPAAMQSEVYAFVDDVVYGGGTLRDLLTRPRTFVNADLAEIYEVVGVPEEGWTAVDLDPTQRAGLLTLSGFLAWQANRTEPNLIERGAFVNDALLCVDVPPPPPTATELPDDDAGLTLRERIENHTSGCGGTCHNDLINPIGFGFGRYDEDGRYQTLDGDTPIDASASYTFTEGTFSYDGAVELSGLLAESEQVHRCYVGHLSAYLEGRSPAALDAEEIAERTEASLGGASIRDLLVDVVTDPRFREIAP